MVATIFAWGCALFGAMAVMTTFYGYVMQRDRDRWRDAAFKNADALGEQVADANHWLREAADWRKRAIYMVEDKVPGETREETCIRQSQDALWQQPEDWKYAEAIQAKDATGGEE